jgi:hypothetical protein
MSRFRAGLAVCVGSLVLPGAAARAADKPFEGVVTFHVQGDPPLVSRHFIKGARTRIEYEQSPPQVTLVDRRTGTTHTLWPERKEYVVSPPVEGGGESPAWPKLVPTGRKETVAGHPCEHFVMGEGEYAMDYCIARGLGHDGVGLPEGEASPALWEQYVKRHPGGSFALTAALADHATRPVMVATAVEKKPLDDALFVVPPGYKEQKPDSE